MNENEIHVVTRTETHLLCLCPCGECGAERDRRATSLQHPLHKMSFDTAHALGFVGEGHSEGSFARQLMVDSPS